MIKQRILQYHYKFSKVEPRVNFSLLPDQPRFSGLIFYIYIFVKLRRRRKMDHNVGVINADFTLAST